DWAQPGPLGLPITPWGTLHAYGSVGGGGRGRPRSIWSPTPCSPWTGIPPIWWPWPDSVWRSGGIWWWTRPMPPGCTAGEGTWWRNWDWKGRYWPGPSPLERPWGAMVPP